MYNTSFYKIIDNDDCPDISLKNVQDKAYLRLGFHSAIKMDDFFVVPPYQRDTSITLG